MSKMHLINSILDFLKEHFIDAFLWVLVLISPSYSVMGALLIIIIADFITGIWAAVKKDGWKSIKSNVMSRTVSKIVLYYIAIIAGLACENLVPGIPFTNIATGFVAIVELKSVYENVSSVTGVEIWDAIKKYLDRKTENKDEN